jgi:hypothetical protein
VRLALRGTGARGRPRIALYTSGRWRLLQSPPTGVPDTYSAAVSALGDVTAVIPVSTHGRGEAGPSASTTPIVVLGAALGLMLASFLLIRLAREDKGRG